MLHRLAYAQTRLILAKVLFSLNLELTGNSNDWLKDQRVIKFWVKPPLNLSFMPEIFDLVVVNFSSGLI